MPIISIFRYGSYESGDLNFHISKTIDYFTVLINHFSLPRWSPSYNAGFGDSYALFAYQLPYISGSLLHLLGFSFVNSTKLVFAISFVLSGITMYVWAKEELRGEIFAFASAIFYLFSPYHLLDMHFRGTIGESISFIFPPLLLFLTKKFINGNGPRYGIFLTLSLVLLILSHQAISLAFMPILIAYAIIAFLQKKPYIITQLINYLIFVFFGLLLSFFYWFPVLIEKEAIPPIISGIILASSINQLLFSPYRFGFLFQGPHGELAAIIGYTQFLVIIVSFILLFVRKIEKKIKRLIIFSLVICFFLIFINLPISKPIWEKIPLIENIEFSTRLLVIMAVFTSILAGATLKVLNKKIFTIALVSITIFYTVLNWGNRGMINIDDQIMKAQMLSTPTGNEAIGAIPINLKKMPFNIKDLDIISGKAETRKIRRFPYEHAYKVEVFEPANFIERTLYFPGWTIYANGKQLNINYQDKKYPGIITFKLNKGKYDVLLKYNDTWDRVISYQASLVGLGGLILYYLFLRRNRPQL